MLSSEIVFVVDAGCNPGVAVQGFYGRKSNMGRPLTAGHFPQVTYDPQDTTTSKSFVCRIFSMVLGHGLAWFRTKNENGMEDMSKLVIKMPFEDTKDSVNSRYWMHDEFYGAAQAQKVKISDSLDSSNVSCAIQS